MSHTSSTVVPPSNNPATLSQQESLSRILNAYLRETGQYHPRISHPSRPEISLVILLHHTQRVIYGTLLHLSAGGHHVYGDKFYTEEGEQWKELSFAPILSLLLDEVSFMESDPVSKEQKRLELEKMINNSQQHLEAYLSHAMQQAEQEVDFLYSEQSLLCGHPFHPTPKSLEGFSDADSRAYSPEFGSSFPLHCFAVAPEYIAEDWLDAHTSSDRAEWVPTEMKAIAQSKLSDDFRHYVLLPCHPWQAKYLRTLEPVNELIQQGLIIDLGSTGPLVFPTSSVRTVWSKEQSCFYKLSLHIRITNFIRENTYEQLRRTLDASRVVDAVQGYYTTEHFRILLEKGYRTVRIPTAERQTNEEIMAGFSMILREAPEECAATQRVPYVIASLLEIPPGQGEPILFRAVREGLQSDQPDWFAWLREYLHLSMKPILHLYAETGISLEAHVQNSMLSLDHGMPAVFYVRDLEGISVNLELAEQQGWINKVVEEGSPVLYSEEQARHRLKYYFFVNHLSHLIQRLAYYTGQEEQPYWRIVGEVLQHMRQVSQDARMQNIIDDLMTSETLPAKANLLSRFHQRGETPLFVDIPNPIRQY